MGQVFGLLLFELVQCHVFVHQVEHLEYLFTVLQEQLPLGLQHGKSIRSSHRNSSRGNSSRIRRATLMSRIGASSGHTSCNPLRSKRLVGTTLERRRLRSGKLLSSRKAHQRKDVLVLRVILLLVEIGL